MGSVVNFPMKRWLSWLLVTSLLLGGGLGEQARAELTSADINRSIERGVAWLRSCRLADGSWPYSRAQRDGATALCVFALLVAGVPADDPAVDAGIRYFIRVPPKHTYTVALNILALSRADPRRYRTRIAECAQFLVRAQQQRPSVSGMWTYGAPQGDGGDNSNTQFAMLGLYEAMRAGVAVPSLLLQKADGHYTRSQNRDGGWGYRHGARSTGSMTAAGVASLHIVGSSLYARPKICGQYSYDRRLASGLQWLGDRFTVERNPGGSHHFYYLYALERAGMLSGLKYFGTHDWYREGAEYLVLRQSHTGSWNNIVDTSFALLFLAKGKIPVLINKLKWRGDWNNDRHDAEHLCEFVGEQFGQTVGWQVVSLGDGASTLRQAPILYFNGHGRLTFTQAEKDILRNHIDQGGFIFAEACCGREPFHESFLALAQELFPERKLEPLPTNHPVWRSFFRITARPPLMGITMGCRTPVIYSPFDMSCAWEKMESGAATEQAFQLGANICAYATGREPLPEKLDQERAAEPEPDAPTQKKLRGAFTFAQMTYSGDWDTGPLVGKRVSTHLRQAVGMTTASTRKEVALADPDLFEYPFLFMSGRDRFRLTEAERARLREYLERGGFLFAEAACGSPEFDTSFRRLLAETFPERALLRLPLGHPLFRGYYSITEVEYTPAVRAERPDFNEPFLEELTVDGRIVLVYSKYSLGYGIEKAPFLGSRGLTHESALRLFANVIIYAMTY